MRVVVALVLAVVLAAPVQALAVAPAQRGQAFNAIEKQTMCIACNVSLNIANAPEADAERVEIRRLLDQGLSEKQVLSALVAEYGPNILAQPEAKGFNVLAFVVPIGAVGGLLVLALVLLPRWKRNRDEAAALEPEEPLEDVGTQAEHERLDAELARYGA